VLKINRPKINPNLICIEVVQFRQEYVGVGFANRLQLNVLTLHFSAFWIGNNLGRSLSWIDHEIR